MPEIDSFIIHKAGIKIGVVERIKEEKKHGTGVGPMNLNKFTCVIEWDVVSVEERAANISSLPRDVHLKVYW